MKVSALATTPTSTESTPWDAKLRCRVKVQIRQARNPTTMLQIAPSLVPRRQFSPNTTGTKKKLAMNFACSTTMAWTSPNFCRANQKGTQPSTTIEMRLTARRRRCEAAGLTSRL